MVGKWFLNYGSMWKNRCPRIFNCLIRGYLHELQNQCFKIECGILPNWGFVLGYFSINAVSIKIRAVILKEINPEYSLEGLMLKLHYFGHLMWRAVSLEKTQMLGKIEGRRRRGSRGWDSSMASWTQWTNSER